MASEKNMVPVTITYINAGTKPPVFVAGSFSQPPWEAMEMRYTTRDDGVYVFTKKVAAEEGTEIQYKFRMGPDKSWVLDEAAPSVEDEAGNRNNVMKITVPESTESKAATPGKTKDPEQRAASGDGTGAAATALPKAVLELRDQDAARKQSRTPELANVAAEVADTAAMLDPPEPEPYIPDDEAGKLGLRRLTHTPIAEVAQTAAEVADSAAKLDQTPQIEFPSYSVDFEELAPTHAEEMEAATGPPLFAYECAGMESEPEVLVSAGVVEVEEIGDSRPSADVPADDEIDFDDPTLERFPSDVASILQTVRSLEADLEEDADRFVGVPPSPVVGPEHTRFTDAALVDDSLLALPPSPNMAKKQPDFGGTSDASAPQLDTIAEDPAAEATHKNGALADNGKDSSLFAPVPDDAVIPLLLENEQANALDGGKPVDIGTNVIRKTISNYDDGKPSGLTEDSSDRRLDLLNGMLGNRGKASSGQSKRAAAGETGPSPNSTSSNGITAPTKPSTAIPELAATVTRPLSPAVSSSMNRRRLARPPTPENRSTTPNSLHAVAGTLDGKPNGNNWLIAFFRVLFVDWIGGFFDRFSGGGRKKAT